MISLLVSVGWWTWVQVFKNEPLCFIAQFISFLNIGYTILGFLFRIFWKCFWNREWLHLGGGVRKLKKFYQADISLNFLFLGGLFKFDWRPLSLINSISHLFTDKEGSRNAIASKNCTLSLVGRRTIKIYITENLTVYRSNVFVQLG